MMTEFDVLSGLRELAMVFRPPNDKSDLMRLAGVYRKALDDMDEIEFQGAIAVYIKTGRYWPRPTQLLEAADQHRRDNPRSTSSLPLRERYQRWQSRGDWASEPCPVCNATVEGAEDMNGKRPQIFHEHQIHYDAGVGYAGPRTGPVDNRKQLLPTGSVSTTKAVA